MIQVIAGGKGEGKTKKLLEMANVAGKMANGNVVFIDDDRRHIYDLHYDIRFIDTNGFLMEDYKMFYGFICGILSRDTDIEKVYIDGVNNIVRGLSDENMLEFIDKIEKLSRETNVDFTVIINAKVDLLPDGIQKHLIA